MRAYSALPAGYHPVRSVDLQNDKKTALTINGGASAGMVVLAAIGHFLFVPLRELLPAAPTDDFSGVLLRLIVLLAGMLAYTVLHELTHAAVMKAVGGRQVRFGFTGLYAYAGSELDWFDRSAYLCISLAPVVVWGLAFTALLCLVPRSWFWVAYLLQVMNLTGAAGDFYVACLTLRMPERVLARDTGVAMTFFLDQ